MNRRYPRTRPFFTWRGLVCGLAVAALALLAGFLAAQVFL
jgi:hypothetical protein